LKCPDCGSELDSEVYNNWEGETSTQDGLRLDFTYDCDNCSFEASFSKRLTNTLEEVNNCRLVDVSAKAVNAA